MRANNVIDVGYNAEDIYLATIKCLYDNYDCQKVMGDFNITKKKTGKHLKTGVVVLLFRIQLIGK